MTFIDDDEIEKIGRDMLEDFVCLLRAGDGLIESEVDFVGGVDPALPDLGHDRTKGFEVVDQGLIDQDVAVRQKEHALDPARFPEPPDDLEGGVGLAGARGHDQQDTEGAPGDSFDGGVDRLDLIVTGLLAGRVIVIGLSHPGLGGVADIAMALVELP